MTRRQNIPLSSIVSCGIIGAMILRFSSMDKMLEKMDNMHRWVRVKTH
jgi:hypothetical protein